MNNNPTIKTAEQTTDPAATRAIVEILRDISPEYADYSYNLIDCLERMVEKVVAAVLLVDTAEDCADVVMYLLAKSIEKIHDAMVHDYDNAIENL